MLFSAYSWWQSKNLRYEVIGRLMSSHNNIGAPSNQLSIQYIWKLGGDMSMNPNAPGGSYFTRNTQEGARQAYMGPMGMSIPRKRPHMVDGAEAPVFVHQNRNVMG